MDVMDFYGQEIIFNIVLSVEALPYKREGGILAEV